jgi:hypothetical protein
LRLAALEQERKIKRNKEKLAVNRVSLLDLTSKLTASSGTQMNMKECRLNYNKLGKFERAESVFRDKFR